MTKKRILFICTFNSCRSQMAEGWARKLFPETIDAQSAGLEKTEVDPLAIEVMTEVGIDISHQTSKRIDEVHDYDLAITLCADAEERCPATPGKPRIHFPVNAPQRQRDKEATLSHYRRIRDEIRSIVSRLPDLAC